LGAAVLHCLPSRRGRDVLRRELPLRPGWRGTIIAAFAVAATALSAGCGGDDGAGGIKAPKGTSQSEFERQLKTAQTVTAADFPATRGRTLQQVADPTSASGTQVGLATSVLVPGSNRVAFGVLDAKNAFVYGKTAVYVAPSPGDKAQGPFPAPADSLITEPAFRSRTAASESDPIAAVYAADVPLKRAGRYAVLVATKTPSGLVGASTQIEVKRDTVIPAVGERPPAVETDTLDSARGDIKSIDTRIPPAPELHEKSLKNVLGKQPVALLFATPQLCQSRVCGPVVDIELEMKAKYGEKMAFIHQEVYEDNQVDKGLRQPLLDFDLQTEPWLFTFDRTGRVAARVEGSFGTRAFEQAIEAALR